VRQTTKLRRAEIFNARGSFFSPAGNDSTQQMVSNPFRFATLLSRRTKSDVQAISRTNPFPSGTFEVFPPRGGPLPRSTKFAFG